MIFLGVCFDFSFMPALRLVILRMLSGEFGEVCSICGEVRRPPIWGSPSSKVMSGVMFPSTTPLTEVSAEVSDVHVGFDFACMGSKLLGGSDS